jgi:DNA-binding LacI/PurR family transcriptional regulator
MKERSVGSSLTAKRSIQVAAPQGSAAALPERPAAVEGTEVEGSAAAKRTKANRRYASSTDVARLAGVSQSAVSRAFSEGKSISEETSRKVFEAAKKLGYSPNFLPRILFDHRSRLVAIAISGAANPFYALALQELTAALQETGHQVLLVYVEGDHALDGAIPKIARYRVDAIVSALPVLSKEAARALADIRVPTIAFNTPVSNRWVSAVCVDSIGGAAAVADLFVARGARSFAFIGGSEGSHASLERRRGYEERLRALGASEVRFATGGYSYEGGFEAAGALCAVGKPDAIFCANDLMAIGAIDALRDRLKIRVPEEVLVAGFDDIPQASWGAYNLTTVVQDYHAMVAEAVSMLQKMISADRPRGRVVRTVASKLVERQTTAAQLRFYDG